ncbi:hypothetical protein Bca4012_005707 [Brassica carinata]
MNLYSKCYRILRVEEDLTAVAKSAVKNSLKLPSCSLVISSVWHNIFDLNGDNPPRTNNGRGSPDILLLYRLIRYIMLL